MLNPLRIKNVSTAIGKSCCGAASGAPYPRVVGAGQRLGLQRRQHCQPVSEGETSGKSTQFSLSPFLRLGKCVLFKNCQSHPYRCATSTAHLTRSCTDITQEGLRKLIPILFLHCQALPQQSALIWVSQKGHRGYTR